MAKSLCQYRLRFLISGYEIGKNLGSGNLDTCQKPIQAGNCSLFQPFSISLRSAGAPKKKRKMLREQCQWCLHHTALATAARLAALLTRSTLSGRTGYVHLSSLFQQESGVQCMMRYLHSINPDPTSGLSIKGLTDLFGLEGRQK